MTVLYLHIGTPKTGTSFMQAFLRNNEAALKEQGYVYPDFDFCYPGIGKNRNGQFMNKKFDLAGVNYENCVRKIGRCAEEYENILISEESLWNNGGRIPQFVEDMKKKEITVKILVYLRRQDLYLQSQWAQNVKETMSKSFVEFAETTKVKLDYYDRLKQLESLVGTDGLIVRVYEKQQFEGTLHNLCSDYLQSVGIRFTDDFIYEDKLTNPSLSGIYLETKRMMNRNPQFATKQNFIVPYFQAVMKDREAVTSFSANRYFTYEQQMDFLEKYRESNERIAREFLHREDGILFRDEIRHNGEEQTEYKAEDYMDVATELILKQREKIEALADKVAHLTEKYETERDRRRTMEKNLGYRAIRKLNRIFGR